MREKCKRCSAEVNPINTQQFIKPMDSTPFHIKNNSVDYLEIHLFQCLCGNSWFSLYYLPVHRFLNEVKIAEIIKDTNFNKFMYILKNLTDCLDSLNEKERRARMKNLFYEIEPYKKDVE